MGWQRAAKLFDNLDLINSLEFGTVIYPGIGFLLFSPRIPLEFTRILHVLVVVLVLVLVHTRTRIRTPIILFV